MDTKTNEEWAKLVRAQVNRIDSLTLALSDARARIDELTVVTGDQHMRLDAVLLVQAVLAEALKYARDWLAGQDGNAMLIAMNNSDVKAAFAKMDLALSKVTL
jgi:hypothetical protein